MKVTVNLQVTDTEWGRIADGAARAGMNVEDYIAVAALMADPDDIEEDAS